FLRARAIPGSSSPAPNRPSASRRHSERPIAASSSSSWRRENPARPSNHGAAARESNEKRSPWVPTTSWLHIGNPGKGLRPGNAEEEENSRRASEEGPRAATDDARRSPEHA